MTTLAKLVYTTKFKYERGRLQNETSLDYNYVKPCLDLLQL